MEHYRKPYTKSKNYNKLRKKRGENDHSLRLLRAKAYQNNSDDQKSEGTLTARQAIKKQKDFTASPERASFKEALKKQADLIARSESRN